MNLSGMNAAHAWNCPLSCRRRQHAGLFADSPFEGCALLFMTMTVHSFERSLDSHHVVGKGDMP